MASDYQVLLGRGLNQPYMSSSSDREFGESDLCFSVRVRNGKPYKLSCIAVFEIALIRDKWLFTRTSKQSVSSYPSDRWKFTTIFYFSLLFYYNAVVECQNARDFMLETANDRDATWCHKNNTASIFSARFAGLSLSTHLCTYHRCQPSRIRRDSPAFSSDVPRPVKWDKCPAFLEICIIFSFVAD